MSNPPVQHSPTKAQKQRAQQQQQQPLGASEATSSAQQPPSQSRKAQQQQQQQQPAASSTSAPPASANKKKAKQAGAHGSRVQASAPDEGGDGSDEASDSSNGGDDASSAAAREAEERMRIVAEELRASRTERAEQAKLMRALQEQIARLTDLVAQPAPETQQQQQQQPLQQLQQARNSAAYGAPQQEERLSLERQSLDEDEEDARSHLSAGSSASSLAYARARLERDTRKIEQPKQLAYENASDSGALETWIDAMELLFVYLGIENDEEEKLKEIQKAADRDVRQWWRDQRAQAVLDGAPIDTWARFLEILRTQFLPQLEVHKATSELINIRQAPGEPMEKYFLRATRLQARTNGTFPDSAVMNILLDRVRKEEWRYAVAAATREVQAGHVKTTAQLRALLQREAMVEPNRPQQSNGGGGGSGSNGSAQSKQQNGRNTQRKQAVRAAAIGHEEDNSGEEDESSSSVRAAPVQQRASSSGGRGAYGGKCVNCGKPGHKAAECKAPESRTCFLCGTKGHIATACAQHYKNKAGAASGSAPPKNE